MVIYGIRIVAEDENFPIVEYYDELAAAEQRKEELITLYEQIRQNNINWIMQFQGLAREDAERMVERTEVKIEAVGPEEEIHEVEKNHDNQAKIQHNQS